MESPGGGFGGARRDDQTLWYRGCVAFHAGHRYGLALTAALLCLAQGCVTDEWHVPADACARCDADEAAVGDASDAAAPDAGEPASCAGQPLRALAVGHGHYACALRCDGSVWCWGANDHGQLGDGTTVARSTPVQVRGLGGPATAIGAGYQHACAVVRGEARCWGQNLYGNLGDGTREPRLEPATVPGLDGAVVAVAGGGHHTCVILEGGAMRCWGFNMFGGVGDGTNVDRTTPRVVAALRDSVDAMALGQFSTCARTLAGELRCWGLNAFGVLGDGTISNRNTPLSLVLSEPVLAVALLANHICATLESGAVWCWGYNIDGAVGDHSTVTRLRPVAVRGLEASAVSVTVGGRHACVATEDGAVHCWGGNERGQLGDGSTTRRLSPVEVANLGGPAAIVGASEAATCAALRDGLVRCWGANESGQLGNGSTVDAVTPVTVRLPP